MNASLIDTITSVATAAIAVMGLLISFYQFLKGKAEKREAQAVLIDAWWVRVDFNDDDSHDNLHVRLRKGAKEKLNYDIPVEDPKQYCTGIAIRNSSNAPITDLHVHSSGYVMQNGTRTHRIEKKPLLVQALLPPGEYICLEISDSANLTKYVSGWTYPESVESYMAKVRPILNSEKWLVKSISFTDVNGRRWKRSYKRHKLTLKKRHRFIL